MSVLLNPVRLAHINSRYATGFVYNRIPAKGKCIEQDGLVDVEGHWVCSGVEFRPRDFACKLVCASRGEVREISGENTPMAWCCNVEAKSVNR